MTFNVLDLYVTFLKMAIWRAETGRSSLYIRTNFCIFMCISCYHYCIYSCTQCWKMRRKQLHLKHCFIASHTFLTAFFHGICFGGNPIKRHSRLSVYQAVTWFIPHREFPDILFLNMQYILYV